MILHSIRLQNIRSYGEGPDGQGVTIHFEPGINRVAGRNGAGKSTLIEALGFALFGAKPVYEENFKVGTYFLRSGEKTGEVDVTFSIGQERYRVERGIGTASRRKAKLVRLADGFSEGEGDDEVSRVLCRLFKVENRERLTELFAKLIGIKQGRMNLPFDTTPSGAKAHFEPLLDVAVFRQCYLSLLPAAQRLKEMKQALAIQQAGVAERLRERANSAAENEAAIKRSDDLARQLTEAKAAHQQAVEQWETWQAKQRQVAQAEQAAQTAKAAVDLAAMRFRNTGEQRQKAQAAAATVTETKPAYEAFQAAEATLKRLQEQQQQKSALERQKAEADRHATAAEEQAKAATALAAKLLAQEQAKAADWTVRMERLAADRKQLDDTETALQTRLAEGAELQSAWQALQNWQANLTRNASGARKLLSELEPAWNKAAAWEPQKLAAAEAAWRQAQERRDTLQRDEAAANGRALSLAEQLRQIGGGVCPFLKEQCRQFDPAKVSNDLEAVNRAAADLATQLKAAQKEFQNTEKAWNTVRAEEQTAQTAREHVQRQIAALNEAREIIFEQAALEARQRLRGAWPEIPWPPELSAGPRAHRTPPDWGAIQSLVQELADAETWGKRLVALAGPPFEAWQTKLATERQHRYAERQRLEIETKALAALNAEMQALLKEMDAQNQLNRQAVRAAGQAWEQSGKLNQALQTFAQLDQQVQQAGLEKARHQAAHHRYLAAKPLADELARHQQNAQAAQVDLERATKLLAEHQAALANACAGFSQKDFDAAQEALRQADNRRAIMANDLKRAEADATKAAQRLAEWQAAGRELETLAQALRRHLAALQIVERARVVLRDAAPRVAQGLCNQIIGHAQEIFNQLNHEPVQLSWEADSFSLRVNPGPKEKRFAMLSGGEQTKLALAMTLAMIRKLIDCQFAIFDEPTYGADADSRHKIADAVVAVQNSCQFDQLLLVSHDDAFDGKLEHVVTLVKSAQTGTQCADNAPAMA